MNAVMVRLISNPYLSRGVFWANYDLGEGKVGLSAISLNSKNEANMRTSEETV